MNSLNLNAYGVSEMNKQELNETEGGIVVGTITLGPLGSIVRDLVDELINP
jgi:hypothetical protein